MKIRDLAIVLAVAMGFILILKSINQLFGITLIAEAYILILIFLSTFIFTGIFNSSRLLKLLAAGCFTVFWFFNRNWMTNNLVIMILLVDVLWGFPKIRLKPVVLAFIALMIYDLVAVFSTKDMIVLAASAVEREFPLLLRIPLGFSMNPENFFYIGAGDLLVPAIFLKSMYNYWKEKVGKSDLMISLCLLLLAYALGLGMALYSVLFFDYPQPALLYIVPMMLLASSFIWYLNKKTAIA